MLKHHFGAPLLHWSINDPHELERLNPKLRCTDTVSALSPALVDELPPGLVPRGSKPLLHVVQLIPALRNISLHVRYEFDTGPA